MNQRMFLLLFTLHFAIHLFAQPGLKAEYFDGIEFNQKVATRIDSKIDLSWNDVPPVAGIDPHYCSIRWTGRLESPETGTFDFSARVDDGIRVWVGNVLVIDAWDLHDEGRFAGKVKLEKGKQYDLKVEYFNALIEGEIRLLWELPSQKAAGNSKAKVIESKYFFQTPAPKPFQKVKPKPPVEAKKQPAPAKPKPKVKESQKPPAKPQQTEPAVVHADTLEKYIPKNVLFEQSKSILLPESFGELDRLAGFLNRNPKLKIKVEGHTDVIGDRYKNMVLSQERADAVAKYLTGKGVNANRIEAKGYGSSRPL
ncbi:MAG: PA14 domain-containing protein, partial [Bacteroidota bacterium]